MRGGGLRGGYGPESGPGTDFSLSLQGSPLGWGPQGSPEEWTGKGVPEPFSLQGQSGQRGCRLERGWGGGGWTRPEACGHLGLARVTEELRLGIMTKLEI